MEGKMYLVQSMYDEGEVLLGLHTASEIIRRIDFTDCSGEQLQVYDVSKFGRVKPLVIHGTWHDPKEPLKIKVTDKRGKIVFSGYGVDH